MSDEAKRAPQPESHPMTDKTSEPHPIATEGRELPDEPGLWWRGTTPVIVAPYDAYTTHLMATFASGVRCALSSLTRGNWVKAQPNAPALGERIRELESEVARLVRPAQAWNWLTTSIEALCELPEETTPDARLNAYIDVWAKQKQQITTLTAQLSEANRTIDGLRGERDAWRKAARVLYETGGRKVASKDEWHRIVEAIAQAESTATEPAAGGEVRG